MQRYITDRAECLICPIKQLSAYTQRSFPHNLVITLYLHQPCPHVHAAHIPPPHHPIHIKHSAGAEHGHVSALVYTVTALPLADLSLTWLKQLPVAPELG